MNLAREMLFHYYKDQKPHTLTACSVLIGASAVDSFVAKMQHRGFTVAQTAESDPVIAATAYLDQILLPPKALPIGNLICKIHDALSYGEKSIIL